MTREAIGQFKTSLSSQAIHDLRLALRSSYGNSFDSQFSDEEINEIGEVFLCILAGSLKVKFRGKDNY